MVTIIVIENRKNLKINLTTLKCENNLQTKEDLSSIHPPPSHELSVSKSGEIKSFVTSQVTIIIYAKEIQVNLLY